jgi:hypothetical protein
MDEIMAEAALSGPNTTASSLGIISSQSVAGREPALVHEDFLRQRHLQQHEQRVGRDEQLELINRLLAFLDITSWTGVFYRRTFFTRD